MKTIHKKTYSKLYEEVASGRKTFGIRIADFNCAEGDILVLDEIDEVTKAPTGRSIRKKIGFVLKTKDLSFFDKKDIDTHGLQVISLLNNEADL